MLGSNCPQGGHRVVTTSGSAGALDLVIFGVVALDANVLALFPVLGIIAGIALGVVAPLRRRSAGTEPAEPDRAPALGASEPGPSTA